MGVVLSTVRRAKDLACIDITLREEYFSLTLQTYNLSHTATQCTYSAAVTIAALDSTMPSGSEYSFAKKFPRTFSRNKKICATMPD